MVDMDDNPLIDVSIFEEARYYRPMAGKVYKMLHEEKFRGLNPVVVAFTRPLGAHPHEIGLLGIQERVAGSDLIDYLGTVLCNVRFHDFREPALLA